MELSHFHSGTLSEAFVDALFQETHTYGGELDYKAYLDLVLATEFRASGPSLRYFFCILGGGAPTLGVGVLSHHAGNVARRLAAAGHEPVGVDDVVNEILDMVAPNGVHGHLSVSLRDLAGSGAGHTVLAMLTDVSAAWAFANREALAMGGGVQAV